MLIFDVIRPEYQDSKKWICAKVRGNIFWQIISEKTGIFKSKKNIQDAHEAVRPTSVNYEPKKIQHFLTKDQFRVYQLIWARFVATQMKDALFDQTVVDIDGGKFKSPYGVNVYTLVTKQF